jgi:hypothetical protein
MKVTSDRRYRSTTEPFRVSQARKSSNSHITFPFIASSSSASPTLGTGTPQLKSLVTAVGLNPPLILGSIIVPSAKITALLAHFPFSRADCIHSSSRGCKASKRRQEWVEGLVVRVCALLRLQRGLRSSVGEENVPAHWSHWSPRAS